MNLGQTMITMGMFVLLVMSVISANRMLVQNSESTFQTEALSATATIANDLFSEAQGKKFDENVKADDAGTLQPSDFTIGGGGTGHSEFGPSPDEASAVAPLPDSSYTGNYRSIAAFDDVDDYDGYYRIVTENNISGFVVHVNVYYVDPNNPDQVVNYQTFFKKIVVTVSHPKYLLDPTASMTYSSLMSY